MLVEMEDADRMKTESSVGCVFSEGRTGRSSRIWRRKMNPDEIADLLGIELEKIDGFMEELKRDK